MRVPVGFKVVRVNLDSGVSYDFALNRGDKSGPASLLETDGLERPFAARFDPSGSALYIVDFGVLAIRAGAGTVPSFSERELPDADADADAVVGYIVALRERGQR